MIEYLGKVYLSAEHGSQVEHNDDYVFGACQRSDFLLAHKELPEEPIHDAELSRYASVHTELLDDDE